MKRPHPSPRAVLRGHGSPVTALRFVPSDRDAAATAAASSSPPGLLLSGDEYGAVRLWDTRFEECVAATLLDPAEPVLSLSLVPSASRAAAVVQLKGAPPQLLRLDRTSTFSAALHRCHPPAAPPASASSHALPTPAPAALPHAFWQSFCRVRPLPDGRRLVAGGADGAVAVLAADAAGSLHVESTRKVAPRGLVMAVAGGGGGDGTLGVAALEDGSLAWWDTRAAGVIATTAAPLSPSCAAAASEEGGGGGQAAKAAATTLTAVVLRGTVAIAAGAGTALAAVQLHTATPAPGAGAGAEAAARVVARARLARGGVSELDWAPRVAVSAGWDGVVRAWDGRRRSGRLLQRVVALRWHDGSARCVATSADGAAIASGGDDCAIALWDGRL